MINVTHLPVDVEEMRLWLVGYRNMTDPPVPWSQLAKETEIPMGTLQPFSAGKYAGDNEKIARKLFMFRQSVEQQAVRQKTLPTNPGFFQTDTSQRLQMLLEVAHMGRITVGATGPGTGKTMTVREYAERAQPVWIATMKPSCAKLNAMIMEVHRALGLEPRKLHSAEGSTRRIISPSKASRKFAAGMMIPASASAFWATRSCSPGLKPGGTAISLPASIAGSPCATPSACRCRAMCAPSAMPGASPSPISATSSIPSHARPIQAGLANASS